MRGAFVLGVSSPQALLTFLRQLPQIGRNMRHGKKRQRTLRPQFADAPHLFLRDVSLGEGMLHSPTSGHDTTTVL